MPDKRQPLGICDHCLGSIPAGQWYTSKRRPRLHCSFKCKQAANSQAGASVRAEKARQRVARGEWQNPQRLNPPTFEERSRRAALARKREVARGEWRNPALTDAAREKLSRPRRHSGPLHTAIEKLKRGQHMADLTEEEAAAYRANSARLRAARREETNRRYRERYAARQAAMTDEEREAQRERWREANRRRAARRK